MAFYTTSRWQQFCAVPAIVVFFAFWLLPMARLFALPAEKAWDTYFIVLTNTNYLLSLFNTVALSLAVTAISLALGGAVGVFLARHKFVGRAMFLSALTMPLSFPGVIIGFFFDLARRSTRSDPEP